MNKRPFIQDLNMPLHKVHRAWFRIPMTLLLSVFLLIIAIPIGIYEAWKEAFNDFVVPCLMGEQEDDGCGK